MKFKPLTYSHLSAMFDSKGLRKKLFILVGLVFLACAAVAQGYDPKVKSVVSYHDGSVFRGTVFTDSGGNLKMVISTGDTISLNANLIKRIFDQEDYIVTKKNKYHYRNGIFSYTSVTFGTYDWDFSGQVHSVAGYRYSDRLSLGLGVGLEGHDITVGDDWFYHRFLSSFGYGRYYLNDKNWRLYADAKIGYAFDLEPTFFARNTSEDGFLFQPGLGVHIASRNKFKMHFGMSYAFLRTRGRGADWSGDIQYDYQVWINRLVFSVGLELW